MIEFLKNLFIGSVLLVGSLFLLFWALVTVVLIMAGKMIEALIIGLFILAGSLALILFYEVWK